MAGRISVQKLVLQFPVGQGSRQRRQQTQVEIWSVGWHGDQADHLYGAAIISRGEIDWLGRCA